MIITQLSTAVTAERLREPDDPAQVSKQRHALMDAEGRLLAGAQSLLAAINTRLALELREPFRTPVITLGPAFDSEGQPYCAFAHLSVTSTIDITRPKEVSVRFGRRYHVAELQATDCELGLNFAGQPVRGQWVESEHRRPLAEFYYPFLSSPSLEVLGAELTASQAMDYSICWLAQAAADPLLNQSFSKA